MNWLTRLKKVELAQERHATEPTKPGYVGSVAPVLAPVLKKGCDSPAANDPAGSDKECPKNLIKPYIATAKTCPTSDPDRWAWPHSQAMTGREIDTFTERLARFTDKGLSLEDVEALADKLVTRDRESDDRRLCLECTHLAGHAAGLWRCRNWQRAGVAIREVDAQLSVALVQQLQRCDGFIGQTQATASQASSNHRYEKAGLPARKKGRR